MWNVSDSVQLARQGFAIVLISRTQEKLDEVSKAIGRCLLRPVGKHSIDLIYYETQAEWFFFFFRKPFIHFQECLYLQIVSWSGKKNTPASKHELMVCKTSERFVFF